MTTALGLLMILLPAAYPDKISIGECNLPVSSIVVIEYGEHIPCIWNGAYEPL